MKFGWTRCLSESIDGTPPNAESGAQELISLEPKAINGGGMIIASQVALPSQ
jgi:hypothetical protein